MLLLNVSIWYGATPQILSNTWQALVKQVSSAWYFACQMLRTAWQMISHHFSSGPNPISSKYKWSSIFLCGKFKKNPLNTSWVKVNSIMLYQAEKIKVMCSKAMVCIGAPGSPQGLQKPWLYNSSLLISQLEYQNLSYIKEMLNNILRNIYKSLVGAHHISCRYICEQWSDCHCLGNITARSFPTTKNAHTLNTCHFCLRRESMMLSPYTFCLS